MLSGAKETLGAENGNSRSNWQIRQSGKHYQDKQQSLPYAHVQLVLPINAHIKGLQVCKISSYFVVATSNVVELESIDMTKYETNQAN